MSERERQRQKDSQTDRQTERQTDRQIDRQIDKDRLREPDMQIVRQPIRLRQKWQTDR